jgi:hypothetical protein
MNEEDRDAVNLRSWLFERVSLTAPVAAGRAPG